MANTTSKRERKYGMEYQKRETRINKKDRIISIRNLIDEKKLDLAKENIEDYIHEYSEDCYIIHEYGKYYSKIGEMEKAKEYFKKNIDSESENMYYSLYELGKIYRYENEFDESLKCYIEIINSKHKEKEHALLEVATLYFSQCCYDEAEQVLLEIINKNYSNKYMAVYNLIQLKIKTRDIEMAEYYLSFLDKKNDDYQLLKGEIDLYKGDIVQGKRILNKVMKNSKIHSISAAYILSDWLYSIGNYEESLEILNSIEADIYFRKEEILITKINIYFKLKKLEEVSFEVEKLLEIKGPYKNDAFFYLGKLEIFNKNYEKAKEYFKKVDKHRINIYYMAQLYIVYVDIKENKLKEAYERFESQYNYFINDNNNNYMETIDLYLKEKLNIEHNIIIDSYIKELIIDYSKEKVIEHMNTHKEENENKRYHTLFYDEINLEDLYEFVLDNINDDNLEKAEFTDGYIIDYPNIGYIGDKNINQLKIVTLPNSKKIITIFPYDKDRNYSYDRSECKPKFNSKIIVKKRESQIDKFNRKFHIS